LGSFFELFVAWRYLRESGRQSGRATLFVGLMLLGLAVVSFVIGAVLKPLDPAQIYEGVHNWKVTMQQVGLGFTALGVLVTVFGYLYTLQSIFTTISTFGVFLGTMALVIVLSVMNGFEVDLRQKILGSNAHILITREQGAFTDWRDVEQKIDGLCAGGVCIVAHTPYVSSEVVIAANSNHNGVIIKGIDPDTVAAVTDLRKNLQQDDALPRLWPVLNDGGVGRYTSASNVPAGGARAGGGGVVVAPLYFSGDFGDED
jgi:ABC-type lipoprotein release transport system permease subunit